MRADGPYLEDAAEALLGNLVMAVQGVGLRPLRPLRDLLAQVYEGLTDVPPSEETLDAILGEGD